MRSGSQRSAARRGSHRARAGRDREAEHRRTGCPGRAGKHREADGRNDEEAHQSPAWARRSVGNSGSGSAAPARSGSSLRPALLLCFPSAATSAPLLLQRALERDEEVVAVRGGVRGDLLVDLARDDEVDQRLRERLHVEERAFLDRVGDRLGLVVADQIGDAGVRHHHLDCGDAAAVDARKEPLADDAAQDARHDRADHLLLPFGEELDHAADRLGRVDRVERREHEVARLGGLQRRLRGLRVAKLADQDHVRVLAQRASKRLHEVRSCRVRSRAG